MSTLTQIREIVLMGGGWAEGGNITPAAEFNIYVDPHAAHNVFSSGAPITMMPLDVTRTLRGLRSPCSSDRSGRPSTTVSNFVTGPASAVA